MGSSELRGLTPFPLAPLAPLAPVAPVAPLAAGYEFQKPNF